MANGNDPEPKQGNGNDPEPKGTPSDEQKMKRLEQQVEALKTQLSEAQQQVTDLTANLDKALTEDDVKAAVEAAKAEAEKAQQELAASASDREKRLTVENELIKANCIDTAGAMAHIDMGGVEIAKDGHVSGLDVSKLAEDYAHLFQQPNTSSVSSAGTPAGAGKFDYQSVRHCSKTSRAPRQVPAPFDYQSVRHCSKTLLALKQQVAVFDYQSVRHCSKTRSCPRKRPSTV